MEEGNKKTIIKDIHVYMPEGLHEYLRRKAQEDGRSVNNLIVYVLKRCRDTDE